MLKILLSMAQLVIDYKFTRNQINEPAIYVDCSMHLNNFTM